MWQDVHLRIGIKKTCVFKEIGLRAQNMLPILDSILNIIWGRGGGGAYMTTQQGREFSL